MGSYQVVALPGDGIGPEIMDATIRVLEHVVDGVSELGVQVTEHEAGSELYRKTGTALPANVLDDCLRADAVLLSAIGLPDVRKPDGTEVQPDMMMGLRRALELQAAIRPCKLYPGIKSPLNTAEAGIDLVIIRENLEGLFASFGGGCILGNDVATDTMVITRKGTRKVVECAFKLASRRDGRPTDGQRTVTCVDKANIFRSFAFFRQIFFEVTEEYPDIVAEVAYIDAMSLYMVQNPSAYDVLVMENQFGDILSDLGAAIVGGLGLAPSAEIGDEHGLFQPSHGTAPSLAGQNVANPIAMILSAAMMFHWLAERHNDKSADEAANRIEKAVEQVLADGKYLPVDQGGTTSTSDMADAVISAL